MTKKVDRGGGQRGARLPKGPPPTEGKQAWDWHSRAGREAIDAATLRALAGYAGTLPRRTVAILIKAGTGENAVKAVGASLKRNEAAGLLSRHGLGTMTEYAATKAGREAAKGAAS